MTPSDTQRILRRVTACVLLQSLMSCNQAEFTATGKDKPGVCLSGSEYVGANFVFMVDNSGSMQATDCSTGNAEDCGPTEREKAILSAFDVLSKASEASEYSDRSISSISIAQFTPEDLNLSIDQFDTRQLTVTSFPEDRNKLKSALEFTRQPKGDTPYLNALEIANRTIVSGDLLKDKDNIVVLVTDGDATDQNPSLVRETAENLDARIITIRVSPENWDEQTRFNKHLEVISKNRYYSSWGNTSYESLEDYTKDLMNLAQDISDQPVIEINTAGDLEKSIFEEIITKNVPCLPQNETQE